MSLWKLYFYYIESRNFRPTQNVNKELLLTNYNNNHNDKNEKKNKINIFIW